MNLRCWAAAAAVFLLAACGTKAPSNELVVGMDLSYPPFETIDPAGQPVGVSVDLARALGEKLGRPVRIENIPFTGLIPALNSGKIDCVISSMTDTPERRTTVDFSEPYLATGIALLAGKNSTLTGRENLDESGRTIVVRQGTTGEIWARANLKKASIVSVEKETSAVLEVVQGRADAFLYDQMSVWKNAQEQPASTRPLLAPLREEKWAVAVRKGNDALRSGINEFLAAFRASGGFEQLGDKYLKDQKAAFASEGIPFVF